VLTALAYQKSEMKIVEISGTGTPRPVPEFQVPSEFRRKGKVTAGDNDVAFDVSGQGGGRLFHPLPPHIPKGK
jgi:hypothetical protein